MAPPSNPDDDIAIPSALRFPIFDQSGVLLVREGVMPSVRVMELLENREIAIQVYATLEVKEGLPSPTEIALKSARFLVGRGSAVDLRIAHGQVSRKHCLFRKQGYRVVVTDVGSLNGTYVNGRRITNVTELSDGDEVSLGKGVAIVVRLFAAMLGDYGAASKGLVVSEGDEHARGEEEVTKRIDLSALRAQAASLPPTSADGRPTLQPGRPSNAPRMSVPAAPPRNSAPPRATLESARKMLELAQQNDGARASAEGAPASLAPSSQPGAPSPSSETPAPSSTSTPKT